MTTILSALLGILIGASLGTIAGTPTDEFTHHEFTHKG